MLLKALEHSYYLKAILPDTEHFGANERTCSSCKLKAKPIGMTPAQSITKFVWFQEADTKESLSLAITLAQMATTHI